MILAEIETAKIVLETSSDKTLAPSLEISAAKELMEATDGGKMATSPLV